LSFANSTANATLTLDNTSGSKQGITLTGGITATGSSATNIVVKSAGGKIAISGTININGDITVSCRIPDDCIDSKRYPLFMAREVMRQLIDNLCVATAVHPGALS
jgi:hypothetical protein